MKQKVVVEKITEESVAVYQYDDENKMTMESPMEVCHPIIAKKNYEIIGEITFNGIELYDGEIEEDDSYPEFKLVEDEDD